MNGRLLWWCPGTLRYPYHRGLFCGNKLVSFVSNKSVGGCQRRNLVDCEYVVPLVTFFVNGVTKDDLLWHYMFRFEIILRALLLGGGGKYSWTRV